MFACNAQMKVKEKQEISMSTTLWGLKSSNNHVLTSDCYYSDLIPSRSSTTKVDYFSSISFSLLNIFGSRSLKGIKSETKRGFVKYVVLQHAAILPVPAR